MPVESSLWFEEKYELDKGRTMKIRIKNLIEQIDSEFQKIEIYETDPFGKMLVLDGVIMCTEWDEHAYHEMLAHVPMFTHPAPEKVLVIGGGDGGTLREVLKHSEVRQADICEIDGDVIRMCRKHLPSLSCSFDDPRVRVYMEDGAKFVERSRGEYDIILVDSADPVGFCKVLFSEDFYRALSNALEDDGIAVTQSESYFYHLDLIETLTGYAKKYFRHPGYYNTTIPTYPSGIIGFTFCSKKHHPLNAPAEQRIRKIESQLKYYNPGIHSGAFRLPSFVQKRIKVEV